MNNRRCLICLLAALPFATTLLAAPEAQLKNRAAILAAKSYVWLNQHQTTTQFQPDVVMIYDFLVRKFRLPEINMVSDFKFRVRLGNHDKASYAPMLHMLVPGFGNAPNLLASQQDSTDQALFGAMWCDRIQLPGFFFPGLTQLGRHGGYALTHTFLAMTIMKDKQCAYYVENKTEFLALEREFNLALRASADAATEFGDLEAEVAAVYAYANKGKLVSEAKFAVMLNEFETKLGRGYTKRLKAHTVVLLLWYLMEYLRPDVTYVPFAG